RWWLGALACWLGWQCLAALLSTSPAATRLVLPHLLACGLCFMIGLTALARVPEPRVFFLCLAAALAGVIALGFEQRFGGLAATRKMMLEQSGGRHDPPFLARRGRRPHFSTPGFPQGPGRARGPVIP
ncbi:MAG TPA: hypothetical protein PKE47_08780, partial [Verrucomicrobiota bacterium]|nr:hypothetical protein [Verrucomicrobiota bacterium]